MQEGTHDRCRQVPQGCWRSHRSLECLHGWQLSVFRGRCFGRGFGLSAGSISSFGEVKSEIMAIAEKTEESTISDHTTTFVQFQHRSFSISIS